MLLVRRAAFVAALALALALALVGPARAAERAAGPLAVAVFPAELYDTSGEVRTAAGEQRLASATARLRAALDALPGYRVVPLGASKARLAELGHIYGCNGCELGLARRAGAEAAVVILVHKVSTLIQEIKITVKEVATGHIAQQVAASIRGDTEQAYLRGIDWLVEHRLAGAASADTR